MKYFFLLLSLNFTGLFAQERDIKVNGRSYHVYTKGFEKRNPKAPAIIFENGLGVGLGHWDTVIDDIAKFAPVLSYNRAGVEQSEKVYEMPTPKFVADNLKALLNTLKIAPPYILIGHSMGGIYVRAYAGLYPNEVAGLVFIDPADFTETKEGWKLLLSSLDIPAKRIDEMIYERLYKPIGAIDSARFGPWSEQQVLTGLRRTDFAELNNLPLPNVPLLFFIGGKFEVPVEQWSKEFDHPKFYRERTNLNIERWRDFIYSSGKGGSLVYLSNSKHFVHRDDAAAVVGNIKLLLDSVIK
jgi:pimeloyl-ACP methyl ester carboxylesterase